MAVQFAGYYIAMTSDCVEVCVSSWVDTIKNCAVVCLKGHWDVGCISAELRGDPKRQISAGQVDGVSAEVFNFAELRGRRGGLRAAKIGHMDHDPLDQSQRPWCLPDISQLDQLPRQLDPSLAAA